ncbi:MULTISPECIES: AAA family ATPase [unclassified Janthinobacterium]|uniref:AAA family ATPase n=1 Tax=unclassified Janthinobacterium TaxID=2610881 RepID=UPI0008F4BFF2|nr:MULTISPECIES: division plane positioning ATPase MipZ [unclassified Janthinobacterium]APA66829.1 cobyrinic acid ac-diamide synthase [Janthinobacterium sp. 1_2014MBL_MicDiv]MDN2708223.1 AAA family ATPase [Janthinobacterium sp. SUN118]
MIIAITDERGGMEKSIVAGRLAASRALAGRKVLLLDADPRQGALAQARIMHDGVTQNSVTRPRLMARAISAKGLQPELEHLVTCYHDIVIDSEGRDSMGSRSALIAARVLVVPLDGGIDAAAQAGLTRRIAHARSFNPGLCVLLATDTQASAAHTLAARIPAARVVGLGQLYCAVFDCSHRAA